MSDRIFVHYYKSLHLTVVISLILVITHTRRQTDRQTDRQVLVVSWARTCDRGQKKRPQHLTKNFDETNQSPDRAVLTGGEVRSSMPLFHVLTYRWRSRPTSWVQRRLRPSVKIIGSNAQGANLRFSGDIAVLTAKTMSAYDMTDIGVASCARGVYVNFHLIFSR